METLYGLAVRHADALGDGQPAGTFYFTTEEERSAVMLCLPPTLRVFRQWTETTSTARSAMAEIHKTLREEEG